MAEVGRTGGIHATIHSAVQAGGDYRALRVRVNDEAPNVLFRLSTCDSGLNYHRYSLARNSGGTVFAGDVFLFLAAEDLSHSFRRGWLSIAKLTLREACAEYEAQPDPFFAHLEEILEIDSLVDREEFSAALELYRSLPEPVQKAKYLIGAALMAAQGVSDADYGGVIDLFRRAYPQDASLDLLLFDGYFVRKKFDRALRCIERFDELIQGDDLLSAKRAACLLGLGRIDEAREAVYTAIAGEPEMRDGYAVGLDVALAERNFDDTLRYMMILEDRFDLEWDDLTTVDDFAEFVKSPQYKVWLETQ